MVMDSFDLNKQELLSNSPAENAVNEEAFGGVERQIVVPDRGYEHLTQPTAERVDKTHMTKSTQPGSMPVSAVIRQPISSAERFKKLEAVDRDVIESSWVSGVKKTIESTRNHPSLRNQQINQIRKIYQEKRKAS